MDFDITLVHVYMYIMFYFNIECIQSMVTGMKMRLNV